MEDNSSKKDRVTSDVTNTKSTSSTNVLDVEVTDDEYDYDYNTTSSSVDWYESSVEEASDHGNDTVITSSTSGQTKKSKGNTKSLKFGIVTSYTVTCPIPKGYDKRYMATFGRKLLIERLQGVAEFSRIVSIDDEHAVILLCGTEKHARESIPIYRGVLADIYRKGRCAHTNIKIPKGTNNKVKSINWDKLGNKFSCKLYHSYNPNKYESTIVAFADVEGAASKVILKVTNELKSLLGIGKSRDSNINYIIRNAERNETVVVDDE